MRNMNCRNVRHEIEEAGSADLLSAAVISHLDGCAACETLARRQTKLQAIVSSLGTVEAPGDFDFRLRARLAAERHGAARSVSLRSFSLGLRSAAVAVMLLLLGSAFLFVSFRTRPANPVANNGRQTTPVIPDEGRNQKSPGVGAAAPAEVAVAPVQAVGTDLRLPERPAKRREARNELAALRGPGRVGTRDFSRVAAPVLKRDDQLAQTYPTAAFPINASYQSLKVSVDDGSGASRTISLPSVSFGSQRTLSQSTSPLMASARGTW